MPLTLFLRAGEAHSESEVESTRFSCKGNPANPSRVAPEQWRRRAVQNSSGKDLWCQSLFDVLHYPAAAICSLHGKQCSRVAYKCLIHSRRWDDFKFTSDLSNLQCLLKPEKTNALYSGGSRGLGAIGDQFVPLPFLFTAPFPFLFTCHFLRSWNFCPAPQKGPLDPTPKPVTGPFPFFQFSKHKHELFRLWRQLGAWTSFFSHNKNLSNLPQTDNRIDI